MTQALETDLLKQKTKEYDNLPGLILGLDGWILRSLPTELRGQFLSGYEKLLRIVFHPDRYTNEALKQSRQTFLQHVNEAVKFLTADSISYEIATDSVPTHTNPILALRRDIEIRDTIIERMDATHDEKTKDSKKLTAEIVLLRRRIAKIEKDAENRKTADWRMRNAVRVAVQKYAVPIGWKSSMVTGRLINFKPSQFYAQLGIRSSVEELPDSPARSQWIEQMETESLLGNTEVLEFSNSNAEPSKFRKLTMIGALTLQHLSEWIRFRNDYAESLDVFQVVETLKWLEKSVGNELDAEGFKYRTHPFLIPFFNSGMILLMKIRDGVKSPHHRLFLVDDVASENNLLESVISQNESKMEALNRQLAKAQIDNRSLKTEIKFWKQQEKNRLIKEQRELAKLKKTK